MPKRRPKVIIVILTWNACQMTKSQLGDVAKLETKGLEVETLVVDNGSTDGTDEELSEYRLPNMGYRFLETGSNLGFAGGNNVGIKDAIKRGSDYVLLMNNDLILSKDLLVQLVKAAEWDKKIGLLSPKMYFARGYEFHKDRYQQSELGRVFWYAGGIIDRDNVYTFHRGVDEVDHGQYDDQVETDTASGACVLIRREVVKDIGYLREKYFLYWEDADYSERARRAGWKVVYTPATFLWHKVSQASGIGSHLNDYFLTRNRLDFGLRYARPRTKAALIKESVKHLLGGRKWQKIGTRDFFLGRFGKGSWGTK